MIESGSADDRGGLFGCSVGNGGARKRERERDTAKRWNDREWLEIRERASLGAEDPGQCWMDMIPVAALVRS